MNKSKEKGLSSWFWILEVVKIVVLLTSRYGLGIGWGISIFITFVVAVVLVFGLIWWMKRKTKDEN